MTAIEDKVKAGAKAVANEINNSYKDMKEELKNGESEIGKDIASAADNVEAGIKAIADKIDEEYRDLKKSTEKKRQNKN